MKKSIYTSFLFIFMLLSFASKLLATDDTDNSIAKHQAEFNSLKDVYRLKEVRAVDYTNKLPEADMKMYMEEAIGEFNSKDYAFDTKTNTMYIIGKKSNFYKVLNMDKSETALKYSKCANCDALEYTIKTSNGYELVLDTPSPDGKGFFFQFIFIK